MNRFDVRDVLQSSFLGALPEFAIQQLERGAHVIKLSAGQLLYDPEISIIVEGTVWAYVDDGYGRHLTVSYMRRPGAIGVDIAAGRGFPVAFQAVADSTIIRIPRAQFDEVRQDHSEVGWAAAQELTHYVDDLLAEIVRVAFRPVRVRIAHHLLALTDCEHQAVHQAELAAAVGSVREVVARNLGPLREACLIEVSQAGVAATDEEGLREVAESRGRGGCDMSPPKVTDRRTSEAQS
jgi:CRP/FNR family cyclic AMP-dependent transcriptional regulator